MKMFSVICAGACAWLLAGCATPEKRGVARAEQWIVVSTNQPASRLGATNAPTAVYPPAAISADQQRLKQEIAPLGLPPELVHKVSEGKVLALPEIEQLSTNKVNEDAIIAYVRSTDAVYLLTTEDIERMRNAGVSQKVLDYLLSTRMRPTVLPAYRSYYQPDYYYYRPYEPWGYRSYYPHYYHGPIYHHHHHPRNSLRRLK